MPEEVVRNAAWVIEEEDDGTYTIRDHNGKKALKKLTLAEVKALGVVEAVQ